MSQTRKESLGLKPNWKLWLEKDGEYVFGPGAYAILLSINEEGSITKGAKALSMSYRYAWGVIKRIEEKIGMKLLETRKGGPEGGGGAVVTPVGLQLIKFYSQLHEDFSRVTNSNNH